MSRALLAICVAALIAFSCSADRWSERRSLGPIISAQPIISHGTFSSTMLTTITTERGVFMIEGIHSVPLGDTLLERVCIAGTNKSTRQLGWVSGNYWYYAY